MPAADNTQTQMNTAQPSATAGTPMPDDPTDLLFQAPDYSQVPVRRRQPAPEDESEQDDRSQKQQNDRGQRNRPRKQQQHQQSDRRDRNTDDQETGTIDTTRTAKTGTSVTTGTSTLMRVLTGKTSDDPAVDAMTTASSNHRMTSNQSRTVDVGAVAATLT